MHKRTNVVAMFLSAALVTLNGCAQSPATGQSHAPVVYGSDDREDVYAYHDQSWARAAAGFAAAMVAREAIDQTNPDDVRLSAPTLQAAINLCADERFGSQPTAADCSATLIAPDLVLTAGHCISDEECAGYSFVFDYYADGPSTLHTLRASSVYACSRVVVRQFDQKGDFAIVRLDRPVEGRAPAAVATAAVAVPKGTSLVVNGYPTGLPLKLADGAKVRDAHSEALDFLDANLDTFAGNSGSGVFRTDSGQLVGILVSGEEDYVDDVKAGCTRVNRCPDDGCSGERSTYAFRAIAALCQAEKVPTLCGQDRI